MNKQYITSIAIGGFDGLHLAHQELFKQLDSHGAIIVIQTPYANLTPKTYRENFTSLPIFYYDLKTIKSLSGKDFIKLIEADFPNLKTIIVGFDFKFGFQASCDIHNLKQLFQGEVKVIEEFSILDIPVHSNTIRNYIKNGNLQLAKKLLGRYYQIQGTHIKGQGLGSKEFVPTINIECNNFLIPASGIYYTYTIVNNHKYLSATFVGDRITTDNTYAIETHLIDTKLTKITTKITIIFIEKIRNNKKFSSFNALKEQILKDIQSIKVIAYNK